MDIKEEVAEEEEEEQEEEEEEEVVVDGADGESFTTTLLSIRFLATRFSVL